MIDVDHFKQISDQYGQQAGDAVLEKLASILQADARSGDLVFRYRGKEFCIVCPGATLEIACAVAERIRQNAANQSFQIEGCKITVTLSIGVAIMAQAHPDEEALIQDAYIALYNAKDAGCNRVTSSIPASQT
jgi:diguanylate cyclase (GGDEF)-like protein